MTGFAWPTPSADVVGALRDGAMVRLRAPGTGDLDGMVVSAQDARSRRFTHLPENYSREDAALFFQVMARNPGTMLWVIDDLDAPGEFGGTMEVRLVDQASGTVELGYTTAPHLRGRGVMTTAVSLMTEFLFDYGVHRVQICANPMNRASCAVARGAGFRCEGRLRDAEFLGGSWNDLEIFARLAGDS